MRIIAGRYKNRRIEAPEGYLTRPTTERVRESIFNLLTARIGFRGLRVLDLFAGTGALALEALSRGAAEATLVEHNRRVMNIARRNAESMSTAENCRFVTEDAMSFLGERPPSATPFDLAFADPPYELPEIPILPDRVAPHVTPGALLVLEHDARHDFDGDPRVVTARPYGRTTVTLFQVRPSEASFPDTAPASASHADAPGT